MPILRMMNLEAPDSWEEFEVMTKDAFAIKWNNPNLVNHGRKGQAQQGVDVYGNDHAGVFSGIQCKKYDEQIDIAMVKAEAKKAESFVPTIKAFYMATTNKIDATLQKEVRKFSDEQKKAGKFPVGIFFWPDILSEVTKDRTLLRSFYPEFADYMDKAETTGPRELALLDISYRGTRIKQLIGLLFGEFGFMAQEDPNQIVTLTSMVGACSDRLIKGNMQKRIDEELNFIERTCLRIVRGEESDDSWEKVGTSASYVQQQVDNLIYVLTGRELTIFKVGRILGKWDESADDDHKLSTDDESKILSSLKALVGDNDKYKEAEALIAEYQSSTTYFKLNTPQKLYNVVRSAIGEALENLD